MFQGLGALLCAQKFTGSVNPYVQMVSVASATDSTTQTATLPGTPVSGNKLYMFVFTQGNGVRATVTTPSGYTLDQSNILVTNQAMYVFRKTAGASESPGVTLTASSSCGWGVFFSEWSGAYGTNDDVSSNSTPTGTTTVTMGATDNNSGAQELFLAGIVMGNGGTTIGPFSANNGFTKIGQVAIVSSATSDYCFYYNFITPIAGYSFTQTSTSNSNGSGMYLFLSYKSP